MHVELVKSVLGKGFTQLELGEELGVSNVTISRWVTGKVRPQRRFVGLLQRLNKTPNPLSEATLTDMVNEIRQRGWKITLSN